MKITFGRMFHALSSVYVLCIFMCSGWLIGFALVGGNAKQKAVGGLVMCIATLFTLFAVLVFIVLIRVSSHIKII